MNSLPKTTLHASTRNKPYGKLTKKQHIGRELELWGEITHLQLKLRAARKTIRKLKAQLREGQDPWKHFNKAG